MRRRGYLKEYMPPHSLPLTLAGMGILWIVRAVDAVIGMRVTTEDEVEGLDVSQHGESGYTW